MKALERYCDEWQIHVNCSKTKIVVFGGGIPRRNTTYELFGEEIENVDCYKYLGITFHRNGKLKKAQDEMIKHASKAMYALVGKGRRLQIPADLMIELFYSLIIPIVTYGSEVWGFSMTRDLEKLQLKFLRMILNIKPSTCNSIVYGETGVYPVYIYVNKNMIGYWCRILMGKASKLCNIMYQCMLRLYHDNVYKWPWLVYIRKLLDDCGQSFVWDRQTNVNVKWLKLAMERRMKDQWIQKWQGDMEQKSSCYLYRMYKCIYGMETYLKLSKESRLYITKFRTSNSKIPVVLGRYNNTPRENRKCHLCQSDDIGDEYHLLLKCDNVLLQEYRELYFPLYYIHNPSIYKFCQILNNMNELQLEKLAMFLKKAFVLL